MNNNTFNDIKVANPPPSVKPVFAVGQNIVVILDKKIVQKLGISEDNTLVQQEITEDGILLKPRRYVQ